MKNPKTSLENLLFTTVRINTIYPDLNEGYGTGFFIECDLEDGLKEIYLVTNNHVIENGIQWKLLFNITDNASSRGKPLIGQHTGASIGNANQIWIKHDIYDIAILYFNGIYKMLEKNKKPPFIRTIHYDKIPTQNEIDTKIDAFEDVFIVGYPDAMYDSHSLIPVVRRGITATPFSVDFEKEPKFLIDASIFPGSSGSPVLLCDRNLFYRKGGWNTEARTYLLGIVTESYFIKETNEISQGNVPTNYRRTLETKQMIDLGIVYKSSIIKEMIDSLKAKG